MIFSKTTVYQLKKKQEKKKDMVACYVKPRIDFLDPIVNEKSHFQNDLY